MITTNNDQAKPDERASDSLSDALGRAAVAALGGHTQRAAMRRDAGQATTEYALVLLAAALVGLLVVAWATSGGGAAAIGRLFQRVIESVIDRV